MATTDNRFPIVDETIVTETASDHPTVVRILTVDDEPVACKLLALILAPPAFHCTSACNAETAGHSQRVCNYSIEIARTMGWSEIQLRSLARGAHLHDIGKLGIPDGILLKPGPLSLDEWKLMQRHVQIGFDLVKDIPFVADAAEIVLTHHERYDGGGYPRGLKGVEILISSRIFAVADSFDAITSDRPYRKSSSFRSGIEIIRQCSGTQFDPQAVSAFLSIPEETWPAIAKDQRRLAPRSATVRENKAEVGLELGTLP